MEENFRAYLYGSTVSTLEPGIAGNPNSSQYYAGDLIYRESDDAFVFIDFNGNLQLVDYNQDITASLNLDEDPPISEVVAFVNLAWSTFSNIDSNTIFDAVLEAF